MRNVDKDSFQSDVIEYSNATPIVVMVHAAWCGPCKTMKPLIERLSEEHGFVLRGIDAGEQKDLAKSLGVSGVPTLLVIDKRLPVARRAGGAPESTVVKFLTDAGVLA
jgi:putative thioredoxin